MNQTIEQLWNGTLAPCQRCGNSDTDLQQLIELMHRNSSDLLQILNDTQKETFEKYTDCSEEYVYLLCANAFQDGFFLATKLITAAFSV